MIQIICYIGKRRKARTAACPEQPEQHETFYKVSRHYSQ